MRRLTLVFAVVAVWLLLAILPVAAVENASVVVRDPSLVITGPENPVAPAVDGDRASYTGTVRLQIVEPTGRWRDSNNKIYEFGLLDYALNDALSVADGATWEAETTWNSTANGVGSISQDNIMVQAVVFNSTGIPAYSDPPSGGPYTAYYADAAAQAIPGTPGVNSTALGSTHTVFVEEASATW